MTSVGTLLTIGYEKRSIEQYVAILRAAKARVVVDVRETAWSHKRGFSKTAFRAALATAGIEYVHVPVVGNPKRIRDQARTHAECLHKYARHLAHHPELERQLDDVIRACLLRELRVCLTCFERHHDDCHRSILAERWAARHHGRVEHLASSGCPRLLPA